MRVVRQMPACLLAILVVTATLPLAAQAPRTVRLGPPVARLSEEFSGVISVRELSDGRVLVSDSRDNRLVMADFGTDRIAPVGSVGEGPGEYLGATLLLPLGGDSTLMGSVVSRRWNLIYGGRVINLAPSAPFTELLQGAGDRLGSSRGRLVVVRNTRRSSSTQQSDSSFVVLVSPATMKEDTVHQRLRPFEPVVSASEVDRTGSINSPAYRWDDRTVVAPDGWIAHVRPEPYQVSWYDPASGAWRNGAPIAEPVVRVTAREKEAFEQRRRAGSSGQIRPQGSNSATGPSVNVVTTWPETIPPFTTDIGTVGTTHDGRVVVFPTPTADHPNPRYDVIDRQGVREYQIGVSSNEKTIGFGRGVVYVVSTDEFGLQTLSRHRWHLRPDQLRCRSGPRRFGADRDEILR